MTCGGPSENDLCGDCERAEAELTPEELALDGGIYDSDGPPVERAGVEVPAPHLQVVAARRGVAIPASQIRRERIAWLDAGRVPLGLVTVLAGIGGLGKSQWTCLLAGRLSRGELGVPGA